MDFIHRRTATMGVSGWGRGTELSWEHNKDQGAGGAQRKVLRGSIKGGEFC